MPCQELCALPAVREVPQGALLQPCMPEAGVGGAQAVLPGSRSVYVEVLESCTNMWQYIDLQRPVCL